jgi:hypothetical protein
MDELQHLVLNDVVDTGEELGRCFYGNILSISTYTAKITD